MEKRKKMIDVIVPVYNVERFVAPCIDSLLEQTIPIQIILVDDGSKDGSSAIVADYAKRFPEQITLIVQENQGLSGARNTGLQHVTAEYCAFMDSDDWVSPDYYEALLDALIEENADISCADITFTYTTHTELKPANTISKFEGSTSVISRTERTYKRNIIDVFPMIQNKLWKTAVLRANNMVFYPGKLYEDLDFFYRIYPFLNKIAFTTKGTFYYRQRKGSIVKMANPQVYDITAIFTHIIEDMQSKGVYAPYQEAIEYLLIRNCLVASSKRLAYARDYKFIYAYLKKLLVFVESNVPKWRSNKYIRSLTVRHIYLKSIFHWTLPFHAFSLLVIGAFLNKKDEFV